MSDCRHSITGVTEERVAELVFVLCFLHLLRELIGKEKMNVREFVERVKVGGVVGLIGAGERERGIG
jgi:AICAR transformylase/IMP cyclohydrolase PurH